MRSVWMCFSHACVHGSAVQERPVHYPVCLIVSVKKASMFPPFLNFFFFLVTSSSPNMPHFGGLVGAQRASLCDFLC